MTGKKVSIESAKETYAQGALNGFKALFTENGVELTEELDNSLGYVAMSYNMYDIFRDLNSSVGDFQDRRNQSYNYRNNM